MGESSLLTAFFGGEYAGESNSDAVARSVLPSLLGNGHPHTHRNHLLAAVDARQVAFGAHVVKEDDVAGVEAEVWMRDELPMNNRPHVNGGGRNLQNQDSKHLASASCHQGSNREQ